MTKEDLYELIKEKQPNICQVAEYKTKPTVFDRVDFIQEYIEPYILDLV